MNIERGESGMRTVDSYIPLVGKRHAILILQLLNVPCPVSYDELHVGLNDRFADIDRKGPSKRKVKSALKFLARQKLLEVVEGRMYQITPLGTEAARDLTPSPR